MDHNDTHNDDELRQEAPTLFGLSKENPMQVPSGYFEQGPERTLDFILQQESPTLSSIKSEKAMEVPEGYFENAPQSAMEFIEMHEARERRTLQESAEPVHRPAASKPLVLRLWTSQVKWSLAAMIVMALGAYFFFNSAETVDEFAALEVDEGILQEMMELDDESFVLFEEDQLADAFFMEEAQDFTDNNTEDNDEVIDYLIEHDIDLETIIEEL